MYKNILVPTDGSKLADEAVKVGIALAKEVGAKLTVLTVTIPFQLFGLGPWTIEDTQPQYDERMREYAAEILAPVTDAAKMAGVPCKTVHVAHEYPYRAIIDTTESEGCDLILMASHGRRGIAAIILGSETLKVLTHSRIPVLVHR